MLAGSPFCCSGSFRCFMPVVRAVASTAVVVVGVASFV